MKLENYSSISQTSPKRPSLSISFSLKSFGSWSELVFPLSRSKRPKWAPPQGTPMCEPSPKESVGIFGVGCEILEQAPDFRRYSSFCQWFQEKVGKSLDRSLSPAPPLTERSSPHFPTPSHPTCTPLIISICCPTPCSIYMVSSGSLWPSEWEEEKNSESTSSKINEACQNFECNYQVSLTSSPP